MYSKKPTEEQLHIIKQDLLGGIAEKYIPLIRILQSSNGVDDGIYELLNGDMSERGIERYIGNKLLGDIISADAYSTYFEQRNREVYREFGVEADTLKVYLCLLKEYSLLLDTGGLAAFMTGLGPTDINPKVRNSSSFDI